MKIKCPACSKVLSVPDSAAGKVVKCPCGKQLRAPAGKSAASPGGAPAAKSAPAAPRPATPRRPATPAPATPAPVAPASFDGGDGFFDELTESDLQPVKAVNKPGLKEVRDHSAGAKLLDQYAPGSGGKVASASPGGQRVSDLTLASPGSRIIASLIDGMMYTVVIGTGFGIAVAVAAIIGNDAQGEPSAGALMALNVLIWASIAIAYLINIVLISKSGQSVGKKAMGIRMVNRETGVNASFGDGWFTRNVVFGFLTGIPLIGFFIALADIVFLFLDGHETLHDKLAKTMVVKNNP